MQAQTTKHQRWDAATAAPRLLVMAGGEPRAYVLVEDADVVVGRGDGTAIQVDHPSVSREHVRVSLRGGVVTVTAAQGSMS